MSEKKIQSALISVFDKAGLEPVVKKLHELGVTIYSTGGTGDFIGKLGIPMNAIENLTGYPSILGGRVKTLHPKVFGGILARRDNNDDKKQLAEFSIPEIDLVIVDLYPFEKTVASGASHEDIIEKIDVGGVSLIRAAAKNHKDVLVVARQNEYVLLHSILENRHGVTLLNDRKIFAAIAFDVTSHYDTRIFEYMSEGEITSLKVSEPQKNLLRYGENPHQQGIFFGNLDEVFEKLNGKELSYNNLLDVDAAVLLINEFQNEEPTFAILKHNNACGIATRKTLCESYAAALACDPVSAFGGILICNRPIDLPTAQRVNELFCEVVIAPSFENDAIELLRSKANRILLRQKALKLPETQVRSLLNGYLWQQRDGKAETKDDLKQATTKAATGEEIRDLVFANKLVKHTKSNTIVLAKDSQLCASGTGQTSRVDALRQAIEKAQSFGFDLHGAVMASDAFFPFPDCVQIAHEAGIAAVVQPGGSIKDQLSVDYCNSHGVSMFMTGTRHFRH